MRLLQLSTGSGEMLDLHPNVTVVAGLDSAGRRVLVDTIQDLARGRASGAAGLLEAHGVLFDLSNEMLELLDVVADGLQPVVAAADLPTRSREPRGHDRVEAERVLAELEERLATATEDHDRRQRAVADAAGALERARRDAGEAEGGAPERIRSIDDLTRQLDAAQERRRRLLDDRAARGPEAQAAAARRAEVEESTTEVRTRHQQAAIHCSELAAQLDQARHALDPDAVATAAAAAEQLARVEAEVAEERAAAARPSEEDVAGGEPPEDRLARVQDEIDALEKRLAAFGPTEVSDVANALDHLRARQDGELVPSAEAQMLAEQLAELEADLVATSGVGATSGGLAEARARLDDARHALLEAEQAARNPELDRAAVDRLELAHADVLDALEKAEGRFGGGRAQRRVESARAAEQAILDDLGFGSYSDYMMGYSLLHVDPEQEAALDAARTELAAAEDAWSLLQAQTEAELARAERMERRRLLLEEATVLLGRPVPTGEVVAELRAHRVPAVVPPELLDTLQRVLDEAGMAVGDEALDREDLIVLAEAWLEEATSAVGREQDVRRDLMALTAERDEAVAVIEAAARAAAAGDPSVEEEREARLHAARAALHAAEARQQAHLQAEAAVGSLGDQLAAAAEAERRAADDAAGAEAAVADAIAEADRLAADLVRMDQELEELERFERESNEHLQSLTERESATPEELAHEVARAEAAVAALEQELQATVAARAALEHERRGAQQLVDSLPDLREPPEEGSAAEEIEWYLLARLAAQRAVSLGGSLPILLDDALAGLDEDELGHVLGRLERMADAVQVIIVTDDPQASSWALVTGEDRAALVRPQPV